MAATLSEASVDREGGPRARPETGSRFDVRMEGLPVGTFTGCDGLPSGSEFCYGRPGTITLTRRVAADSVVLASWLATLERVPGCTVVITAYDAAGRPTQAWRLREARPAYYSAPRTGADARLEKLELAHCGVLRAAP